MKTKGMTVTELPKFCANLLCVNKTHEGSFVLVEQKIVATKPGMPKMIRLWMCYPCGAALSGTWPDG